MPVKIKSALITVKSSSSSSSFFADLSRNAGTSVNLYVYRYPKTSLYYVIADIPKNAVTPNMLSVVKHYRENILKISRQVYSQRVVLTVVKQRCEFYELIEDYDVVIPMPYTLYRGDRKYCVYGESENLDKYVENLVARYGRKNVFVEKTDLVTCLVHQIKNAIDSYVFTALTEKEKQLLFKAFESGYLSHRRKVSLEELAESLNIAKPTASLILRKAIEKVIRNLTLKKPE